MPAHIPEGFHSLTPYLVVDGVARLLDFLRDAFGAEEIGRYAAPDGRIMHAVVRIGDSMLEMGEPAPEWSPMPCGLHLYVEDADAVYARALEAGGVSLAEPSVKPYGDREAGVRDPSGNFWYIATRQEQVETGEGAQGSGLRR
ncbi:MAG TPA: VOC family protein [Gemmatimonadota bacterium]|nr:VOC family protein [Gemmatimonadota bacterium]